MLGTGIAALAGLAVALATWTGLGGLPGLVVPLFVFVAATGLIVANSIAGARNDFPARSGAVSALVGAMQYGSGILGSGMVSAFTTGTPLAMGLVIALTGIGSLLCAAWLHQLKPASAVH
ncbi:hypothetical protein GCM10007301_34370 [Azorhizobium oxalatiphilum]|uniref:Uncharacterized protein n=1 Tax=Azorhizobium oxalatiphilum TaxID=980631 RepID=A0A917C5G2_9HYPH|nr:hypothetical protein [Azorhizobium oxalatiphilum]GGF71776.1 hypothetical protein GCM10007301_34370 [Azorhizobium oxalatiphilum]